MKPGQLNSATWTGTGSSFVVGCFGLYGSGGGSFDILLDGSVVKTFSCDQQTSDIPRSKARSIVPMAFPVSAAQGSHTIQVRRAGRPVGNGTGPFLDYIGVVSPTPPRIVVVKGVNMLPGGYADVPGAGSGQFDAYNAVIDTVAAELPNVSVCDPRTGWVPATMVGADSVHPNAARSRAHRGRARGDAFGRCHRLLHRRHRLNPQFPQVR
jgi:hypothetical protein